MTPEQIAEGRRVLADALRTDAMPVTARERDLAQSEYRVWVENNLRELLDAAEDAALYRRLRLEAERDALLAAAERAAAAERGIFLADREA